MRPTYGHLAYWLLPFLRARVRTEGREHVPTNGPCILAANHNAWVDTPLLGGALYRRVPKKLFFISRSRHYASLGAITIDPRHPSGVLSVAQEKLAAGHCVVVYPEGGSNPRPWLIRPKTGVARLAHTTGRPVIPVGIRGTFGITPPVSIICFLFWFRRISVTFGPPLTFKRIPAEQLTEQQLRTTAARVMGAIGVLCHKRVAP